MEGSGLVTFNAEQLCPKVVNPCIRLKIKVIPNLALTIWQVMAGTEGELGSNG